MTTNCLTVSNVEFDELRLGMEEKSSETAVHFTGKPNAEDCAALPAAARCVLFIDTWK